MGKAKKAKKAKKSKKGKKKSKKAKKAGHPVVWVDAQSIVCDQLLLHQLAWNDDERVRNDRCSPIASGNVLLVGRIPHMVVLCGVCIRGFLLWVSQLWKSEWNHACNC